MKFTPLIAIFSTLANYSLYAAQVKTLENGVQVIEDGDKQYYTGLLPRSKEYKGLGETHVVLEDCEALPDEFDLRDLDVVPPVKNQGSCGSCWAFSETASLESAHATLSGSVLDLAEQQLVSCDSANSGCGGGWVNEFSYVIKNGLAAELDFPYQARDLRCKTNMKPVAKGKMFVQVGQSNRRPTEKEVMCAVFKSHTIPWVTVSAGGSWSSMPSDSNALHTRCSSGGINHAVGIIGWKKVDGKVYFKMRNSWGKDWGSNAGRADSEKGYAMMKLFCDSLGDDVSYVMADQMSCQPPLPKLPREISAFKGDFLPVMVAAEVGTSYEWFIDGEKQESLNNTIQIPIMQDADVKIVAKNACGTSESRTRIKLIVN